MGFLINDALILIKSSENIKLRNNFYSIGVPTSHVSYDYLIFLLNDKKNKIKKNLLEQKHLKKIYLEKSKTKKISFEFFVKLLNFKNFYSIDINPKEKPSYCVDITKINSKKFQNKADMIYDTGSLGYTNNPLAALIFLSKLIKKWGVIVHQVLHNGYNKTGHLQFNLSFFIFYYKSKKFKILKFYYGFFNNYFKRLFFRKKWMINIEASPSSERVMKSKTLLYFIAKKN